MLATLFAAAVLLATAVAAVGSDSRPSAPSPALVVAVGPEVQALATTIVARVDPRTHRVGPALRLATARFRIVVTNTGPERLVGVAVSDPRSPGCNRLLGELAPGASLAYACSAPGVGRNFVNAVTASARFAAELRVPAAAEATARATATAVVRVKPPKKKKSHVPPPPFKPPPAPGKKVHVFAPAFTG
jgi:hypothetical protein